MTRDREEENAQRSEWRGAKGRRRRAGGSRTWYKSVTSHAHARKRRQRPCYIVLEWVGMLGKGTLGKAV